MTNLMFGILCFVGGFIAHKGLSALWTKVKAYMLAEITKLAAPAASPTTIIVPPTTKVE